MNKAAPCRSRSATRVDPVEIADTLGGEIVRMWVASVDFREDVACSPQIDAAGGRNLSRHPQHVSLHSGKS